MPPKSILKKTSASTKPAATKTREERHREIALHHAYLIQDRKDAEAAILSAIESLIDYPTTSASTSAHPSSEDVDEFTKLIYPFTPSDYDELIEERRIDGRCGYVFCAEKPKVTAKGGKLKIVNGGKIVDRSRAESWCSDICAKRALFVKVQLMETPVWERRAGKGGVDIEILTEESERRMEGREGLDAGEEELEGKMRELELERGDEGKPARKTGMILESIVEKGDVKAPKAPKQSEGLGELVEGYLPKGKKSKPEVEELGDRELNI